MFRAALISMFLTSAALADTWTVDDDGKADFDNIQAAVDAASDGDEIIVMPGTYTSTADEVVNMLGKAVWLHSSGGQEVTFIDGDSTRRGIVCDSGETSKTIIEGITITNGYASFPTGHGGGMRNVYSDPTIINCAFTGNTADSGGGMYNYNNSSPTLTNCTFIGNTAAFGGGMYNSSSNPTLTNCIFENNTATNYGGGMRNSSGSPTMIDTTVCGNTPDQIYGSWTDGGGSCVAYSCEDNNGDGIPDKCTNPGGNTILVPEEYATIQDAINVAVHGDEIIIGPGTYTGVGNWVVNPMGKRLWIHSSDGPEVTIIDGEGVRRGILCNSGESSETIIEGLTITNGLASSFGGGMVNSSSNPTLIGCTFTNNNANYGGGMSNIESNPTLTNCTFEGNSAGFLGSGGGMYNDHSSPTLTNCTFTNNNAEFGGGMSSEGIGNNTLTNCTFTNNTADYGAGMNNVSNSTMLIDTVVCGNTPDQIIGGWTDGGGSCVAYSCEDNNGDGIPDKCTNPGGNTILVPEEYARIQDAINVAVHGDEIIIGPGTYTGVGDWVVNPTGKRLWIHSSDGPEVTIIDGEGVRRGIYCNGGETSETIFEGLTITNGYDSYADVGSGMFIGNSSPTLTGCTFTNNTGGNGAALYNEYSNPTLTGCTFTNNTTEYGGGAMVNYDSDTTLTNCTFTNNTASSDNGGGMVNYFSIPTLTNCTFTNNLSGESGGGMYNFISNPTLTNCTFENNTATERAGGMYNWKSSPTLSAVSFDGNTAAEGGGMFNYINSNPTLTDCSLTGNSATIIGDGIYNVDDSSAHFFGTNTSDELYIGNVSSLAFSAESTCDVTGSTYLTSNATISFDIDDIDTSSSLNVSQSIDQSGGLVISNDSGSLLEAKPKNVGDIIPLAQASALVGNFDSIVFPPMPEGLGLQLINPALRGGDTEVAAEVIEIEGANFGDPFSGGLDSPPIDIISFDPDGDGRDEVAVLFGGTPGGVAGYSVSQDGTPTPIDGLVAIVGNDPVSIDAADLNSDGREDLIVANSTDNSISVLLTMEDVGGSLYFDVTTTPMPRGGQLITCVSVIDWDGDTDLDAVVGVDGVNNGYQVLLNVSDTMSTGPWFEIPNYPATPSQPDPPTCVDGGNQSGGWGFVGATRYGRVHRGTSDDSLQVISELAGNNTVTIKAIELDANGGDGQIDLMVSSDEAEVIYLFQGNPAEGDGFDDLIPLGVSLPVEDLIALDADDDGDMDIVMTAPDSDTPVILLRNDGASGGLLPSSLGGQTWSMQIINSVSDVAFLTSGGLSPKDEEDDWIVGGGSSTAFRGETVGVIEQSNILLGSRCDADVSGDGEVNVTDLLAVIDQWGSTDSPADISGDGIVNVTDLLEVVGNWGPCE